MGAFGASLRGSGRNRRPAFAGVRPELAAGRRDSATDQPCEGRFVAQTPDAISRATKPATTTGIATRSRQAAPPRHHPESHDEKLEPPARPSPVTRVTQLAHCPSPVTRATPRPAQRAHGMTGPDDRPAWSPTAFARRGSHRPCSAEHRTPRTGARPPLSARRPSLPTKLRRSAARGPRPRRACDDGASRSAPPRTTPSERVPASRRGASPPANRRYAGRDGCRAR